MDDRVKSRGVVFAIAAATIGGVALAGCAAGVAGLTGEPVAAAGKYVGTMNCLDTDAVGVQTIQPSQKVQLEFDEDGVPSDVTIAAINRTARQIGLDLGDIGAFVDTGVPSTGAPGETSFVRVTLVDADYAADPIRIEIEVLFLDANAPAGEATQPAFGTAMHIYEIEKINTSLDLSIKVIDNQQPNETQYTQCSAVLKATD